MGLDISAFSNIRTFPWNEDDDCRAINVNRDFLAQSDGLPDGMGFASDDKAHGFRAGSYGGYNAWRDNLAKLAGFEGAQDAWGKSEGPFWELINFSDCEGVIGPKTAAKLLKDFEAFDEAAKAVDDHWFYDLYKNWREAFSKASQNGLVQFH